ncbi:MAG: helix-turn-helix domain-containing protein [Mycobacteriales bacterium]|nr:helix-turn-helix domain-containing protein [Mycobacteriales bacterium]
MTAERSPAPAGRSPAVAALGQTLLADLDRLTERLVEAILDEDPSYSARAGVTREDLARSCHANLERLLQALGGVSDLDSDNAFDAPRETGHRRAEQGLPLESVLHAYRLGYRTIWEGLVAQAQTGGPASVDALVTAASEVWELVDRYSAAVADAYRHTESEIARRDDRRRDALLDALLEGRGSDRSVAADAAAVLDLPEHGRVTVVVVHSAAESSGHGAAARDALAVRGHRSAWRTRADREVGIVSLGRATLADICTALQVVPAIRAGVAPEVEGLADVDVAHRMAETALRALPAQRSGVVDLASCLPAALLVTAPDLAGRLVERALGGVLALETDERAVLLDTLTTWLDTGGSAGQTAARLYCHRNTVLNRLRRLEALTGRSLERVDHLVEWSLALMALELGPAPT